MTKLAHLLSGDNDLVPFYLWRKETLLKREEVYKHFVQSCSTSTVNYMSFLKWKTATKNSNETVSSEAEFINPPRPVDRNIQNRVTFCFIFNKTELTWVSLKPPTNRPPTTSNSINFKLISDKNMWFPSINTNSRMWIIIFWLKPECLIIEKIKGKSEMVKISNISYRNYIRIKRNQAKAMQKL